MRNRVAILALGTFAIGTESFVIAGLLPELASDMRVSVGRAGLLVTAFAVVYALSAPVSAVLFSRMERRRLLAASMFLFAVSNLVAAAAPTFGVIAGARIVAAIAAGAYTPAAIAMAIQQVPEQMRGRATSTVLGGMVIALVTSVPLGTYIAQVGGWRTTFLVVAALSVGGAIGVRLLLPSSPGAPAMPLRERLDPLRRSSVVVALACAFLWMTGAFVFYTYVSPLVTTATGWSTAALGPVLLLYGVCAIAGNQLGGYATDGPLGDGRTLAASLSALAVAFGAFAVAVHLGPPLGIALGLPSLMVAAIAGWALAPAQTARMVSLAPTTPTEVLSLNTSANYLGIGAGAALGSVLADRSTISLALVAALCSLAALVGVRWVDRLRLGYQALPTDPAGDFASVEAS